MDEQMVRTMSALALQGNTLAAAIRAQEQVLLAIAHTHPDKPGLMRAATGLLVADELSQDRDLRREQQRQSARLLNLLQEVTR